MLISLFVHKFSSSGKPLYFLKDTINLKNGDVMRLVWVDLGVYFYGMLLIPILSCSRAICFCRLSAREVPKDGNVWLLATVFNQLHRNISSNLLSLNLFCFGDGYLNLGNAWRCHVWWLCAADMLDDEGQAKRSCWTDAHSFGSTNFSYQLKWIRERLERKGLMYIYMHIHICI